MSFANIIVDISCESLDKTYQYRIPEDLSDRALIGARVNIPFGNGNRQIKGYIISITETPNYDLNKIKNIVSVEERGVLIESQMIELAYWMKEQFGATINDALHTVLPVKNKVKQVEKRTVLLVSGKEELLGLIKKAVRQKHYAKERLLMALLEHPVMDYDMLIKKLNIPRSTIASLSEHGVLKIQSEHTYRNPVTGPDQAYCRNTLNKGQQRIVDEVLSDYEKGVRKTYLIHGITGSGKTEIYLDIIDQVVAQGKQVIMLIPEIALTYQTVMRFYRRFGDRISIMNSKMSAGERYDQSIRAKNSEIDIMIGPRSALFTPFEKLGLIIIDEEHEGSYKNEGLPKYHSREVAIHRAKISFASVILGSATPSLESYTKALNGEYHMFSLDERAGNAYLPEVSIVDLREELKQKNRSMFSRKLQEKIRLKLERKEQIILFLNRRGYAGFVSCRSCGCVLKCEHCDISLTSHNNGKLVCHYCGYTIDMPKLCPECGSTYIAGFGTGTQKVESMLHQAFPDARVLRMDADTTRKKESHETILAAFANGEADILVGTQMIVKGHDFPKVTLVGILAADLSLYAGDYRAAERTFQLLLQAAGRAGRGELKGEVIIQTYHPEHYSIVTAANADYQSFYDSEIAYRRLMDYPPLSNLLAVICSSKKEERAENGIRKLFSMAKQALTKVKDLKLIGPAPANLSKAMDIYRQVFYIKHKDYFVLVDQKNRLEQFAMDFGEFAGCTVYFDFNPQNGY